MRLLLLIPNVIFIIISGYNLWSDFSTQNPDYLSYKVLHATVLACCVVFTSLIIKSIYTSLPQKQVNDVELPENVLA
jgi:hypothetical protein